MAKEPVMRAAREVGDVVLLLIMGVGVLGCSLFVLLAVHVDDYALAGAVAVVTAACIAMLFRLERDSVVGAIVLTILMEVAATWLAFYYIAAELEWA